MTPEELNAAHRDFVVGQLSRHAVLVQQLLKDDDPEQINRLVLERGSFLAEQGLLPASEAPRINQVFLALYKNVELEEWNIKWSDAIHQDQRASTIIQTMNVAPSSVTETDFRYFYDTYVASDVFIVPALEIMLKDRGFRSAMELEDGITVDEFRKRSIEVGLRSQTYEQFQEIAGQYSYFGPFICGWTVCVLAIAVVFTWVGTPPVTCTSGNTVLPRLADMVPPQGPELQSGCINSSSRTLWAVVRGFSGFKRVPIVPGGTSQELGLKRIEAIVIGGFGNELARLRTNTGDVAENGCYVLSSDVAQPGVITLRDSDDGTVAVVANDAQEAAEGLALAGYSPVTGDAVAKFADTRYAMDSSAALLPPTADSQRIFQLVGASDRYSRVLQTANWLQSFSGGLARVSDRPRTA